MKRIALDLILVNSDDLHDGTRLTDRCPIGGNRCPRCRPVIRELPYDLMAIANTWDMYTNFVSALDDKHLSSNVNITILTNNTVEVPVGVCLLKLTTRKASTGNEWLVTACRSTPDYHQDNTGVLHLPLNVLKTSLIS
ncbi:hypothetical protein BT96DRAFT_1000106 [Gymnopus androsaceus JB14]|uniref:Uncharacterized protein n=1 Tax=Gymnopus androsaceus JB14 TaxID=1447944 RepID=A0A6A4H4S6_9AGAR|nr:hypothetical protein BT96DRAFT_1000106 [Gymnopus androsaceus JB14]